MIGHGPEQEEREVGGGRVDAGRGRYARAYMGVVERTISSRAPSGSTKMSGIDAMA
jgi:hypothetical protein